MKYVAKHGIDDLDRVKTVIEKAYDSYKERLSEYNPSLSWKDDRNATVSFTVMKKSLSTDFEITPDEVRIEGKIPFIFKPFESKIEKVVGGEVEKWIVKAKNGEL
ncbi:MAG: polyhydroxyalkanoic acid system family protein [Nannocystaceae bacterium]|nr:polyhydroxyalkanoic acid system family protein [bacterium]